MSTDIIDAKPTLGESSSNNMVKKYDSWPTNHKKITSPYNPKRIHPVSGKLKPHTGVDIRSRLGEPNYAIRDGVVSDVYIGGKGSGGNYIKINHGNSVESGYFHTKSSLLKGAKVLSGQIIGISDGSGAITAPHLHFTLLINRNLVNPITNLNFRP